VLIFSNCLTEKVLEDEVGIEKIGYRIRILNKLRDGMMALTFRRETVYQEN
jgi:hypothetical protein